MFWDDVVLVKTMIERYAAQGPFVECGGLESPIIASYDNTIAAMQAIPEWRIDLEEVRNAIVAAQYARYLQVHRPLEDACPSYVCEDPSKGGLPIERLSEKYNGTIGTAILLSVLEHVANPFECARALRSAMRPDGLAIVSVPFMFPVHPSPRDLWRFTPDALCEVFSATAGWSIVWCDWRLKIPADAGVLDIHTMKPQAIESCACVARAV